MVNAQGLAEGGSLAKRCGSPASVERVSSVPPAPSEAIETRELAFASFTVGPEKAVAIVPQWGAAGERFPVLIALHGRGEAVRGLDVGAYSWLRDYELGKTIARLRAPPLTKGDLKGFADEGRLARLNASLAERPFRGLVVVTPWVP